MVSLRDGEAAVNDDRSRDALDLAERALDEAMRDGATEAEALVIGEDAALTRFANSQIHQNVAETNVTINLRVVIGKRVGVASSGRTDYEGLRRLAEHATAIARVVEELDDWAGLPGPSPVEPVAGDFATATADASPELRADAVRQVIAAADAAGVTAYGSFSSGTETTAVANSSGDPGGRHADGRPAPHGLDGPGRRERLRRAGLRRRRGDRCRLDRSRGGRQGPSDRQRRRGRRRRLSGRARGIRGRRPPRHARLPRVFRARGPGGAQLRGDREAHRQRPRVDRR